MVPDCWKGGYGDAYISNKASCFAIFEAISKCSGRGRIPSAAEPLHLRLNSGEQRSVPRSLIARNFVPTVRPERSKLAVCGDTTIRRNQRRGCQGLSV